MDFLKVTEKLNKDVSKMNHIIFNGINVMVLDMLSCEPAKDIYEQDGYKFNTSKHFCEELYLIGLNQPETSFVLLKTQVIRRLRNIILKNFNGITPIKLSVIIRRYTKGKRYYYQILYTTEESNLDKIIECLENRNINEVYDLFIKGHDLKGFRY